MIKRQSTVIFRRPSCACAALGCCRWIEVSTINSSGVNFQFLFEKLKMLRNSSIGENFNRKMFLKILPSPPEDNDDWGKAVSQTCAMRIPRSEDLISNSGNSFVPRGKSLRKPMQSLFIGEEYYTLFYLDLLKQKINEANQQDKF